MIPFISYCWLWTLSKSTLKCESFTCHILKEGANIVITGRNESKLAAAKEELEKLYNIKVLTIQADVNASADNEAVVANVVKQTIDTFGHIDVLINNAQASASGVPLAEHTTEQFNLAMYSGLYAHSVAATLVRPLIPSLAAA